MYLKFKSYLPAIWRMNANPNVKVENHRLIKTPLSIAIELGDSEALLELLKVGADPNMECGLFSELTFPLITAIGLGEKEMVASLLEYGANPNIVSRGAITSTTPLNETMKPRLPYFSDFESNRYAIVDALLKSGANPMVPNNFGFNTFSLIIETVLNPIELNSLKEKDFEQYKNTLNLITQFQVKKNY